MLGTALYYPHIDIRDGEWLRSAVLFWDKIQTIVPTSIPKPYQEPDSRICEQEGYLDPLRCDLHYDVLEDLGKRVLKLMEEPEWSRSIFGGRSAGPSQRALMHADKLGHEFKWRMEEIVGIHPDKMPPELRSVFLQSGGLELLSAGKLSPYFRRLMEDFDFYRMHPEKLSHELRHLRRHGPQHEEGDWIVVNGRFAEIYMSALAALLARRVDVSPLTNEEPSSGVNLRCLIDDVTASGPAAARGALVSVVMEGLRVDPETPIIKLLAFRRRRRDQLAELSGKFDALKGSIEKSADGSDIENKAKRIFANEITPALAQLKSELQREAIGTAWKGFLSVSTISTLGVAIGSAAVPLGPGVALVTAATIGIKSYLARSKIRGGSPYTYLLDIERKFSLESW